MSITALAYGYYPAYYCGLHQASVSQGKAEAIVYASEALHQKYPQLNIQARSEKKLWDMSQELQQALFKNAHMI